MLQGVLVCAQSPWCLPGFLFTPTVVPGLVLIFGECCPLFGWLGPFVWFSGGVLFLFLKKLEVEVVASGQIVLSIFPGITLLSAILVFIKSSLVGSGGSGSYAAFRGFAVLHEPGIRNVLFFVYILRSMMGLPVKGYFILGSHLNFGHTRSLTKSRIHPRALCSKRRSIYICGNCSSTRFCGGVC